MRHVKYFLPSIVLLGIFLFLASWRPSVSLPQASGGGLQQLRVRVLFEDYYDPARAHMRTMMHHEDGQWRPLYGEGITDLVDVHLYESPDSRTPVISEKLPVGVDGWLQWDLPSSVRGSYHVRIDHRLHAPLISSASIYFDGMGSHEWDFTPSSSRSHGLASVALPDDRSGDPVLYAASSYERSGGEPPPPPGGGSTLEVRVFLQGYYGHNLAEEGDKLIQAHEQKSGGAIAARWVHPISDRIIISMHKKDDYDDVLYWQEPFLMTNGWARIIFPSDIGEEVWVSVRHRNHLETVYHASLDFTGLFEETTSIDFTTAADKAYGNNQASLGGGVAFGIYAGDVNQDGVINLIDRGLINNQYLTTTLGYQDTDLNGDGVINLVDRAMANNAYLQTIIRVLPE